MFALLLLLLRPRQPGFELAVLRSSLESSSRVRLLVMDFVELAVISFKQFKTLYKQRSDQDVVCTPRKTVANRVPRHRRQGPDIIDQARIIARLNPTQSS
jgi:hypothetical protein